MKYAVILAVCLFAWSGIASARTNCAAEFTAQGRKIPRDLLKAGILGFYNLDLGLLIAEIGKIKVVAADKFTIALLNKDGRSTARWDSRSRRIVVACDEWSQFPGNQSLLALHEYLGILGFRDEEYRMSTKMWLLSRPVAQRYFNSAEKKSFVKRISAHAKADGGVVGVGGGGDIMSLYFRTEFLEEIVEDLARARSKRERKEVWEKIESELLSNDTHGLWPNGRPR